MVLESSSGTYKKKVLDQGRLDPPSPLFFRPSHVPLSPPTFRLLLDSSQASSLLLDLPSPVELAGRCRSTPPPPPAQCPPPPSTSWPTQRSFLFPRVGSQAAAVRELDMQEARGRGPAPAAASAAAEAAAQRGTPGSFPVLSPQPFPQVPASAESKQPGWRMVGSEGGPKL